MRIILNDIEIFDGLVKDEGDHHHVDHIGRGSKLQKT